MPRRKRDADVLVLGGQDNRGLQIREPVTVPELRVDSVDTRTRLHEAEQTRRREIVDHLTSLGVDVVVTQSGIDRRYLRLLADADVLGVRGVTGLDFPQVCRATGATAVVDPGDATAADLGYAGLVEEQRIEPRKHRRKNRHVLVFDDCVDPRSVTAVLRGVTGPLGEQMARQVRKAAAAVAAAKGLGRHGRGVVPGGGATDLRVVRALRSGATSVGTREQLAVDAFADAVESLVATLVRNGGRDPLRTLAALRAAHEDGADRTGIVLPEGRLGDVVDAGVLDPVAYRRRQFVCATEVAQLVLKIDDAIDAERSDEPTGSDDAIFDDPADVESD